MHPTLIDFGFFQLPSYGVFVALGVIVALFALKRRADRVGMDGNQLVDVALWLVIWALVGAKGLLIVVDLPRYLSNPGDLVGVIRAGGVFLGGFLAALVAAVVLFRRHKLPVWPTVDVIVPSLALGQAIGRIGCLLAGCCWGAVCERPWAITYTDSSAAQNVGTPLHVPLHPWPLYAALFNIALYIGLELLYARRPAAGRVFGTYLVCYGVGRFLLEFVRGDVARGFVFGDTLSTSQLISLILIAFGVAIQVMASRRGTE